MTEKVEEDNNIGLQGGGALVHLLPCNIDYNGPAPIKTFFKINKIDDVTYEAQIRGRGIVGKDINISEHCKGLCVTDNKTKVVIDGEFNSLIYWQHGMEPDAQQIESNLSWFEIAKDLHS